MSSDDVDFEPAGPAASHPDDGGLDPRAGAAAPQGPGRHASTGSPPRVLVPRWIQLVALPLLVFGLYVLARAAGDVLLLFVIAGVIALILNPIVTFLQRRRVPRPVAIGVVFLGMLFVAGAAGLLLANPVADQAAAFGRDVPSITRDANERLADLQDYFDRKGIDIEITRQGETALHTLQDQVIGGTSDIVNFGGELLRRVVTAGFSLVLIVVLSVYMLIYGERIGAGVRAVMPPGDGSAQDDFPTRLQRAVGGYLRGQALFSLAMGAGAGIGMYAFGVLGIFPEGKTYAFAFGAWFGLMELIPFVGPILGAIPPILVALFSDPLTALWVALFFTALQQLEGHIVAPYIFGHTLRINPLLVIFALLTGAHTHGFVGALVALPLAAMVRETVVYLRRHLLLESWGPASPLGLAESQPPPRCTECGAAPARTDAFCRACGAPLEREELASRR